MAELTGKPISELTPWQTLPNNALIPISDSGQSACIRGEVIHTAISTAVSGLRNDVILTTPYHTCALPDGTLISWAYVTVSNATFASQSGALYYHENLINFPNWEFGDSGKAFVAEPYVVVSSQGSAGDIFVSTIRGTTTTNPGGVYVYAATAGPRNITLSAIGIGRWK